VHLDLDTMVASFVTKKYFYCSIFGEEWVHTYFHPPYLYFFWLIPCFQEFNEIPTCVLVWFAKGLIHELDIIFPIDAIMDAL
jgi:hypothetical protein